MATITTGGSGNWSSVTPNAPWPGGTLPTSTDDVVIAAGSIVTLDVTNAVANSVTVSMDTVANHTGFKNDATKNTKLVVQTQIFQNGSGGSGYLSFVTFDVSSDVTKKCEIYCNAARGGQFASSNWIVLGSTATLKGFARTRWSTCGALVANTSKSAVVADATGWQVGDKLVFGTTQAYNATPRTDIVSIATITPGSGTTATVTWTDGVGTTGAVLYQHDTGCVVGNFTSNMIIGPNTAGDSMNVQVSWGGTAPLNICTVRDVLFTQCGTAASFGCLNSQGGSSGNQIAAMSNNAFWQYSGCGIVLNSFGGVIGERKNNLFYSDTSNDAAMYTVSNTSNVGSEDGTTILRGYDGIIIGAAGSASLNVQVSACSHRATLAAGIDQTFINGGFWSNAVIVYNPQGISAPVTFRGTRIGNGPTAVNPFASANNGVVFAESGSVGTMFDSCPLNISGGTLVDTGSLLTNAADSTTLTLLNKNNDPSVQEIYKNTSNTLPVLARDNATSTRSPSALRIDFHGTANKAQSQSFQILAKAGQALTILCWMRMSANYKAGAYAYPFVTLSGLGITPVTVTASGAVSTWALYMLNLSAGAAPANDGLLTFTFTAQCATDTESAYIAGIPFVPFITRARNYGYIFNETNPVVVVNSFVAASETTAIGYTGIAVTGGAAVSPVVISANHTFQEVYDYTQAWGCATPAQVAYAAPLVAAAAGSYVAAANVTINTGIVINGSGSLAMGSFTLTTEFSGAQAYTYTGGTWSQATTVPGVTGGVLSMPAQGATTVAYTFNATDATINFAPSADGANYNLGSGTFGGTITLTNTAGHTATVQLPGGLTIINGTSGANLITVVTPSVYQSVTVSGLVAGSQVQIYDTTSSTQLYNATVAGTSHTWTDPSPAAATRAIRLRVAKMSTVTAKAFIDTNIGTCATSGAGKDISYLVSQVDDASYNTSGIDGSTVTGISIVAAGGDLMKFTMGGPASFSAQSVYAYQVYWQATATGIAQETAFITSPDASTFVVASFQFENEVANTIITVNNGWMVDSVTLTPDPLISTTVGKGTVNIVGPHAVLVTTGSGPLTTGQAASLANAESSSAAANTAASTAATAATLGRKLLSNKRVLDPVTGIETIYDDSGVALYTRHVYEDAAGTQLYRDQGADRAEKYS